jgi:cytochrome c-type biogenesis protein CcmH/NrfF
MSDQNEIKKDPSIQGVHILKSYLNALSIEYSEVSETQLKVKKVSGGAFSVAVGDGHAEVAVDPAKISSFEISTALDALHKVTEFGGYGRPMPVNRGESNVGRISYADNYEEVYLRHKIFRRSPNLNAEQLEPYMRVIRTCARKAAFRFKSVFGPMGHSEDDLVNIGRVHAISFLHNYATSKDKIDNIKLLTEFLHQRFAEFAKIAFKKARNATCLQQDVRSESSETSEGEEVSYIDTFAEADAVRPDEEYEEDVFALTCSDGSQRMLSVKSDGFLGLVMYLDGRQLTKYEAAVLTEQLRSGEIKKERIVKAAEEEQEGDSPKSRREKAREELHRRLAEMDPERRKIVLSYAALARDYDPDSRREARRLATELVCPKCMRRVPSGNVCNSCSVAAVLHFGVDVEAVRDELAAMHHSMAEAMSVPIPESEVRAKAQRPNLAVDNATLVEGARIVEVTPTMSIVDRKALSKKMAAEYMLTLPDTMYCPKCKETLQKVEFGVRVAHNKTTGIPERPCRQSYCKPCRGPNKAKK